MNSYKPKRTFLKHQKTIVLVLFLLFFIGLGIAYLQTSLNFNGTVGVQHNNWRIYFDHDSMQSSSYPYNINIISMNTTGGDYPTTIVGSFHLEKPGDYLEGVVDIKNDGSIDAMLESFSFEIDGSDDVPPYLDFVVTYVDGVPFEKYQILRANSSERIIVRMEYKSDVNPSDLTLINEITEHDYSITLNYVQANRRAKEVRTYLYAASLNLTTFGQPIPNNVEQFTHYDDAIQYYGHPVFLRYSMFDNKVMSASVGIHYNNNTYYFPANRYYFYENISQFNHLFGTICEESYNGVNEYRFDCDYEENDELQWGTIMDYSSGIVGIADSSSYGCIVCNNQATCGNANDEHFTDFCN